VPLFQLLDGALSAVAALGAQGALSAAEEASAISRLLAQAPELDPNPNTEP